MIILSDVTVNEFLDVRASDNDNDIIICVALKKGGTSVS